MSLIKILLISHSDTEVKQFCEQLVNTWVSLTTEDQLGKVFILNNERPLDAFLGAYFAIGGGKKNSEDAFSTDAPAMRTHLRELLLNKTSSSPFIYYGRTQYEECIASLDPKKENLIISCQVHDMDLAKLFTQLGFKAYFLNTSEEQRTNTFLKQFPSIPKDNVHTFFTDVPKEKLIEFKELSVLDLKYMKQSILTIINDLNVAATTA